MRKPRKPIRRVSVARSKQLREYERLKADFFACHHNCIVCDGFVKAWDKVLHHKAKRRGKLLLWQDGFGLTHWHCHQRIHKDETEARKRGWLFPKECCDDYERAVKHYEQMVRG